MPQQLPGEKQKAEGDAGIGQVQAPQQGVAPDAPGVPPRQTHAAQQEKPDAGPSPPILAAGKVGGEEKQKERHAAQVDPAVIGHFAGQAAVATVVVRNSGTAPSAPFWLEYGGAFGKKENPRLFSPITRKNRHPALFRSTFRPRNRIPLLTALSEQAYIVDSGKGYSNIGRLIKPTAQYLSKKIFKQVLRTKSQMEEVNFMSCLKNKVFIQMISS